VAADLHELVAEMTLGAKTKFYNSIIEEKGLKAVRDLRYTRETIETNARVYDILKNTKDIKNVMALDKWKKDTVKNIIGQIHKKQNALARYSKALGVRQENITENNDMEIKNNNKNPVSETQKCDHKSRKDLSERTQNTATIQNNETKNKNQHEIIIKKLNQTNKKQKQNEEDQQKDDKSTSASESPTISTKNNKDKNNNETIIEKEPTVQQGNYKGNNFNPDYHHQFRRGGFENYNGRGRGRTNNREYDDRDEKYPANGRDEQYNTRFLRGGRGRGRI
jgi:hypothetical protein